MVVMVGLTVTALVVMPPGFQLQEVGLPAPVRTTEVPEQTDVPVPLTDTVGLGLTVMAMVRDPTQEPLFPVTV